MVAVPHLRGERSVLNVEVGVAGVDAGVLPRLDGLDEGRELVRVEDVLRHGLEVLGVDGDHRSVVVPEVLDPLRGVPALSLPWLHRPLRRLREVGAKALVPGAEEVLQEAEVVGEAVSGAAPAPTHDSRQREDGDGAEGERASVHRRFQRMRSS